MRSPWEPLGGVPAEEVIAARLALHWAVQIAVAPGKQLLPPQADYSQQSLRWDAAAGALAQDTVAATSGRHPFRSGLRPADLTLVLLDPQSAEIASYPLAGRTLAQGYEWLEAQLAGLLGHPLAQPLERPGEMPAHAVDPKGDGAAFSLSPAAGFAEVHRWFAAFDALLGEVRAENPGASAVRCWPHHFDLATLITLDSPGTDPTDPEAARSIGVGLSPGDATRPEPYVYVTPWPYPKDPPLPALAGAGTWNTEGWLGAVLEARALGSGAAGTAGATGATGAGQEGQIRDFLHSAIAGCRHLMGL